MSDIIYGISKLGLGAILLAFSTSMLIAAIRSKETRDQLFSMQQTPRLTTPVKAILLLQLLAAWAFSAYLVGSGIGHFAAIFD
jgi:hypothetical protein